MTWHCVIEGLWSDRVSAFISVSKLFLIKLNPSSSAPSPITNNVAPAPNLSNNKPRAPTPPPNNKFPVPPPVNNVPLPRPPPPAVIAPPGNSAKEINTYRTV